MLYEKKVLPAPNAGCSASVLNDTVKSIKEEFSNLTETLVTKKVSREITAI